MQPELKDIVQFPESIQSKEGYWQYLTPEFRTHLQNYLAVFEQHRKEINIIPSEEDWKLLPFGTFAQTSEWKWRKQSLKIIQDLIQDKNFGQTLEIGPWNGWLTKYIAQKSETVIAADYFVYPFDGIGNIQTLADNIVAVQCNVNEIKIDFKPQSFDLIVLNHNLAYMSNPVDYIEQLKPLLKTNGILISLGNAFFKNPEKKIQTNGISSQHFFKKYGMDLYILPVKGYLDFEDKEKLSALGFQIDPYPDKFWQNVYSGFNSKAPFYAYTTYKNV